MDTHTLRTARALVWACVAAATLIIGVGTAQEDIALRAAIIFTAALIPAAAAILIGSFIHDQNGDTTNG